MKRFFAMAILVVAALFATSCDGGKSTDTTNPTITTGPGGRVDLNTTAAALSLASACSGGTVTWTYSATIQAGYDANRDGSVSPAGIFTPPICGSPLLNTTVTITGSCTSAGIPHTGTIPIKIGDEIVNGVSIVAAQILPNTCGVTPCWVNTPNNVTVPVCTAGNQLSIQYYAQVGTTCASAFFSPSQPPPPASQTPKCPSSISP